MKTIHLVCIGLVATLVGCGRQPEKQQFLVTVYVEHEKINDPQIVTKTNLSEYSFITLSDTPISVTLPLGEGFSCSTSFQIHTRKTLVDIHNVFLSYGGRKDKDLFPNDDSDAYLGPYQTCSGSTAKGNIGDPIELARWGYGRNQTNLNFKTYVVVAPLETSPIYKPENGCEYEGKLYHVLQNVDPRNMRHGKK